MTKHIHIHLNNKTTDTGGEFWGSEFDNLKSMSTRLLSQVEKTERLAKEVRSTVSSVTSELKNVRRVWENSPDAKSFASDPQGGKKLTELRTKLGKLSDQLR